MVSAGIVNFLLASEVLCFRFWMRKMLITHWWFSCFEQSGRGGTRSWEGTWPGQWTHMATRIFHTIWHHSEQKPGRGAAAALGTGWASVLSTCIGHPLFLCILLSLLSFFPPFFCPIKLSVSQPMSSIFFQSAFPSHWGAVREWLCGVSLPAELNHNYIKKIKKNTAKKCTCLFTVWISCLFSFALLFCDAEYRAC